MRILASIDRDVTAYLAVRPETTADEIQRYLESPMQVEDGEIPGWQIDDILLLLPALGYVEAERCCPSWDTRTRTGYTQSHGRSGAVLSG